MKKRLNWHRIISFLLLGIMVTTLFVDLAPTASAASITDTLKNANIINGDYEMGYLTMNGAVKKQSYTYYMYNTSSSDPKEIPAYCINPVRLVPGQSA